MQGDDGLAGARPSVDDECALRTGADDGILIGLDRRQHIPHARGARRAETGDERRLVIERTAGGESLGGERLIPVVADVSVRPAVAAAADQAHRVCEGRAEERLGRGGAPVDEQLASVTAGEAEAADVEVLAGFGHHASEAHVDAVAAQHRQPCVQPVDLEVAFDGGAADTVRRGEQTVEASGRLGETLAECRGDRGELFVVAGDEVVLGFVGELVRKVEGAEGGVVHDSSDSGAHLRFSLRTIDKYAPSMGPCRKPPPDR